MLRSFLRLGVVCLAILSGITASAQQRGNAQIVNTATDGTPKLIRFQEGSVAAGQPQQLLATYLPLPEGSDMKLRRVDDAGKGIQIARYDQWIDGIPVAHGTYTLATRNGFVLYLSGRMYSYTTNATTSVTEPIALDVALAAMPATQYRWQNAGATTQLRERTGNPDTSYFPKGQLVWIEDYYGMERNGVLHLAWKFDIYSEQPIARKEIFVDASTGKILFENNRIYHVAVTGSSLYSGVVPMEGALVGSTYRLSDNTRGSGVFTLNMNNGTNQSNAVQVTSASTLFAQGPAVDAHWGASKVYDYWLQKHNRQSFDGNNSALYSYVSYDVNYNNAFWDGNVMTYGNGSGVNNGGFSPLTSLDVCAHEIGHGVCQHTADLIYFAESGALNEGFSDIWGATIEAWADPHEVDAKPKNKWIIGEEISSSGLRRMDNPNLKGDPDTYGGSYWVNAGPGCDQNNDNCGVHTNSGVLNYWYYLLVTGGSGTNDIGNPFVVNGIGMDDAAQIAYLGELSMSNNDGFLDARAATIAAATSLFGMCSPQEEATVRAWYAVGVGPDYPPCVPTIAFTANADTISEYVAGNNCPSSKIVQIPVILQGPAPTGGNAVMTATVTGGTAVQGVDYVLNSNTATFPAGSTAPQHISMTVFDNGAVANPKTVQLSLSVTANGSNASASATLQNMTLVIESDDRRPDTGGTTSPIVGTDDGTISNLTSAFYSNARRAKTQYLIPASTLASYGIVPGRPITAISFDVLTKNSSQPFSNYTVAIGPASATTFGNNGWENATTQVFSGTVNTVAGWNKIDFDNPYIWNGTDNLVVQICYNNTSSGTSNDRLRAQDFSTMVTAYAYGSTNGDGCALTYSTNRRSTARPLMKFTQPFAPTAVETSTGAAHSWDVRQGTEVYFYSAADSQIVAGIQNANQNLGCVQVSVSQAGNGFVPAVFGNANRSKKEIVMTATTGSSASYTGKLYFTTAELAGVTLGNLRIVKTTAATDAEINASNTVIVTPTYIASQTYTVFSASFTGFSRFFLLDKNIALGLTETGAQATGLMVMNNPFTNEILVQAELSKPSTAQVRLTDITGRLLLQTAVQLPAGSYQFPVNTSVLNLPTGTYLLQIVTAEGTLVQKVMRQ